jgi:hypothetical protein
MSRRTRRAQADLKVHLCPLLREVATVFPQATVELWAMDDHRIGVIRIPSGVL